MSKFLQNDLYRLCFRRYAHAVFAASVALKCLRICHFSTLMFPIFIYLVGALFRIRCFLANWQTCWQTAAAAAAAATAAVVSKFYFIFVVVCCICFAFDTTLYCC